MLLGFGGNTVRMVSIENILAGKPRRLWQEGDMRHWIWTTHALWLVLDKAVLSTHSVGVKHTSTTTSFNVLEMHHH